MLLCSREVIENCMNKNPFKYSYDNKRYHTLSYYNRSRFGGRICKAVLDCGFTCPNIDGSKGYGGCIFCDSGSGYFTDNRISMKEQYYRELDRICKKYGKDVPITAYFQANTNTYADPEYLRSIYNEVLGFDNIHGIAIATRGDCISDRVLGVLSELNEKTELTVELGMQSVHDTTIKLIDRCCTHEEFLNGYYKLKSVKIRVCLHIINGLPGEDREMMLETAKETAKLMPDAVKLQMLHVIRGTKLAEMYEARQFQLLTKDEYIDIVVKQLEQLPPETVIERITGDGDKRKLVAPQWSTNKISVLGNIDKRQAELDTWQGKEYEKFEK